MALPMLMLSLSHRFPSQYQLVRLRRRDQAPAGVLALVLTKSERRRTSAPASGLRFASTTSSRSTPSTSVRIRAAELAQTRPGAYSSTCIYPSTPSRPLLCPFRPLLDGYTVSVVVEQSRHAYTGPIADPRTRNAQVRGIRSLDQLHTAGAFILLLSFVLLSHWVATFSLNGTFAPIRVCRDSLTCEPRALCVRLQ
ncbi:hypothetical protein CYLTODRAFT_199678 [Cylindrobasidium torrendii FP15055 ss-10]|uniref:Uncharacterized protein n=1 Tax=Cylindrobasidium torrendii FP15055 ss-10 TaxID=1314674 RepID=A0A0D7AU78_9AGAR|nr:hypothetical protein CYLTODRAFT_199678 [Cylindrobasidium torrendii FP15055 ss-10]